MQEEGGKNENILIISGGFLDLNWAKAYLEDKNFDYIIAADSGAEYAALLKLSPDIVLGDFDSISPQKKEQLLKKAGKCLSFLPEKDDTDTGLALKEALKRNPVSITILAGTGTRLDHSLNNIFAMTDALDTDTDCFMADKYNKIYLKNRCFEIEKSKQYGDYLSIVPITDILTLSMEGVKYPLEKFTVKRGSTLCQSNEITSDTAKISIHYGIAAVFESKD